MQAPLTIEQCHCVRCEHRWYPRQPTTPQLCPACKNRNWDQPSKRTEDACATNAT